MVIYVPLIYDQYPYPNFPGWLENPRTLRSELEFLKEFLKATERGSRNQSCGLGTAGTPRSADEGRNMRREEGFHHKLGIYSMTFLKKLRLNTQFHVFLMIFVGVCICFLVYGKRKLACVDMWFLVPP